MSLFFSRRNLLGLALGYFPYTFSSTYLLLHHITDTHTHTVAACKQIKTCAILLLSGVHSPLAHARGKKRMEVVKSRRAGICNTKSA